MVFLERESNCCRLSGCLLASVMGLDIAMLFIGKCDGIGCSNVKGIVCRCVLPVCVYLFLQSSH